MRIVIFTGNGVRHKFVANSLSAAAADTLIVSECKANDAINTEKSSESLSLVDQHFLHRYLTERKFFPDSDFFNGRVLPLIYKEVNHRYVYNAIRPFKADAAVVFGSSIIKEPLLSLLPLGRFINLHLGISPYYRGSGTNFWPFVNKELEYVGSTILHINAGIDTGDIICHVRPQFEKMDDAHTIGCKVIMESVQKLTEIIRMLDKGIELQKIKQWKVNEKYYRTSDFTDEAVLAYRQNLSEGMVERYLRQSKQPPRLIDFVSDK